MIAPKEIGSDYEINPMTVFGRKTFQIPADGLLLSTGMDCLQAIINTLNSSRAHMALLPSYLCKSILIPFADSGIKYDFYKIDRTFCVDLKDFTEKLTHNRFSLALVINYFGFIQPEGRAIKRICTEHDVLLIEDRVQSSLSKSVEYGHVSFNSYRKLFAIPDGAVLRGIEQSDIRKYYSLSHRAFVITRFVAGIIKNMSVGLNSENVPARMLRRIYWKLFMLAERKLSVRYRKPAGISFVSRALLQRIDFDDAFRKRRENYIFLMQKLSCVPRISVIHRTLPSQICPLGMPIICEHRNDVERIFNESKIFPSVHWRLPEDVKQEEFPISHEISQNVLTLPIDQRYNSKDMERVAQILTEAVRLVGPPASLRGDTVNAAVIVK